MKSSVNIAFVTDEVSRNLEEAFALSRAWGVHRFELREGSEQRTPNLTLREIALVEDAIAAGDLITALSPGVFKQPVENESTIANDLGRRLPETLELANRFSCDTIIIFGFERLSEDPKSRLAAQKVFAAAAELAEKSSVVLAIENEPNFWVDKPEDALALIQEINHPCLKLNWDPANLHWGGTTPTGEHVEMLAPIIRNLHVKDFTPDDARIPWRPLGEGITPWDELLETIVGQISDGNMSLEQFTIETHWEPLKEGSERSLNRLQHLFGALGIDTK